jgi:hypothetical protein
MKFQMQNGLGKAEWLRYVVVRLRPAGAVSGPPG